MNPTPDIRDIVGPVAVPDPWAHLPLFLAVAAGIGLLFLAIRLLRLRSARLATPEARAAARLEEARRLLDPASPREFGAAVSWAVRLYVEERFGARASERTTEEFLQGLADAMDSPLGARRPLLERFLQHCDLAKFARSALTRDEMEALFQSARELVTPPHEPRAEARS